MIFDFSVVTLTVSPNAPALPPTLMRSFRYFSKFEQSRMESVSAVVQSMMNLGLAFFLACTLPGPAAFFCHQDPMSGYHIQFGGARSAIRANKTPAARPRVDPLWFRPEPRLTGMLVFLVS